MDWSLTEADGKATVSVSCPKDDKGLYKAHAVGPGGRCLLGTLTPQGDRLVLRRVLRVDALRQRGCWPVTGVECALDFPFPPPPPALPGWTAPPASLPWPDRVLGAAWAAGPRPLYRRTPRGFQLAFLYQPRRPFPLTPLFCFAQAQCLDHRLWLVFSFDGCGRPCFPGA